jgi:hypothetical protein
MKKLILTITLGTAMSCSLFAQGNFIFGTGGNRVDDDWTTPGTGVGNSLDDVALFIELTGTGATPAVVTAGGGAVGTSAAQLPNGLSEAQAWTDILGDSTFTLATNNGTGLAVLGTTTGAGGVLYDSGATFTVTGTLASGFTATVYIVGYDAADTFGTGPVGWSSAFTYTYAAGPVPGPSSTPGNMNAVTPFGVAVSAPEPGTMALAGLGGISMLLFRRRNKA